jgi:hypothetical protein
VPEERSLRQAGPLCDLGDGGLVEPVHAVELECRLLEAFPRVGPSPKWAS